MEWYASIYKFVTSISGKEDNYEHNKNIFEILAWPFKYGKDVVLTCDKYKEQLWWLAIERNTHDIVSSDILALLIDDRDEKKLLEYDMILQLKNIYQYQKNRQDIVNYTHDLSNFVQDEELLESLRPNHIREKLHHHWIPQEETTYITKNWKVDEKNITIYAKNFFRPYTRDILDNKKYLNYNVFTSIDYENISQKVFFIAIDKSTNGINYHCYDPVAVDYKSTIRSLLKNNFLFTVLGEPRYDSKA